MKNVIVRPALSYGVLALGTIIALALVWKAYETITYIEQASRTQATQYHVEL